MVTITDTNYANDDLEISTADIDPRRWMPVGEQAWSLPLMFDRNAGTWVSQLRVEGAGTVERHRHANPVTGYTLDGTWGYRERDWVMRKGSFLYEPAGDIHTLYVHPEQGRMTALFHVYGPLIYLDAKDNVIDYDDVFVRIEKYAKYCKECGLGEDFVRTLIR